MMFLEDLNDKDMVKPGMSFDLLLNSETVTQNFFTVTSIDRYGYNGFHSSHNNEPGRIGTIDVDSWWRGRLRLNLSCYKKLQFDEQLKNL